ncbi:SDR family NAD(P)-dependent oxidoreductase [Pontibacillus yanchengensis]|uniref:SDR family NAD(P)-dependent oxidoreductase n=2 Tax=Pontibacillus yanchengensis TaxID=462910 RepID=A0ACC7VCK8_9BACI|nr:SDR family NAD(P)-dependent oxidoreductase [Pontibacillus yanchengensis]MYL35130.1 SDR family NAD(P)-dependent oxidoreductase [Pontibacillus yanchengensis]MYL52503.1 SDR family NAD(P)-dependent oxidoreductase [Pontibacillus yanchengensis]
MNAMPKEVIIITGSTRGIGRSTAIALAASGAAVVVNGRNELEVQELVSTIRGNGGKAAGWTGCVLEERAGEQLVHVARTHFGAVTGLINNAGIIRDQKSYRMEYKDFSDVIDVHVKGAFICSKAVIQDMRSTNTHGFIVNITSLAGLIGTIGQINYSAAKAALIGMTHTLAKELEKDFIQVNAIAPAAETDMTRPFIEKVKQQASPEEQVYWSIGSPEDVATFIDTFLKERKLQETGEIYAINGSETGRWLPPSYELL